MTYTRDRRTEGGETINTRTLSVVSLLYVSIERSLLGFVTLNFRRRKIRNINRYALFLTLVNKMTRRR